MSPPRPTVAAEPDAAQTGAAKPLEGRGDLRFRVGNAVRFVSPLGWAVIGAALGCWALAVALGWIELAYAAVGLLVLLAMSGVLAIGRTPALEVALQVQPSRVTAGDVAIAEVRLRNRGARTLLAMPIEVPCGDTAVRLLVPGLGPDRDHKDIVVLPTGRRGVYRIGPVRSLRGDPLGLVRRPFDWAEALDLYVHPRTVFLDASGQGALRDLEGRPADETSLSDLAFHALREYVPGDDQRHIHWASTAKRSGSQGATNLMVRQFLDTRRTHVGIVLDCARSAYPSEPAFELAVEAAASLAKWALRGGLDLSQASGPFLQRGASGTRAIDHYARARLGKERAEAIARALAQSAQDISVAILVTGPDAEADAIRRAGTAFGSSVTVVVIRADPGAELTRTRTPNRVHIVLGSLAELRRAMAFGDR